MISFLRSVRRIHDVFYPYQRTTHRFSFSSNTPNNNGIPPSSSLSVGCSQKISASELSSRTDNLKDQTSIPKTIILSEEAQKAVWASKIIQMIHNSYPPISIQKSLKKEIQKVDINTTNYEFNLQDKFKDQILEMFTTGIEINQTIFKPDEISLAQNRNLIQIGSPLKLVFFPTNTVSKYVFRCLLGHYNFYFFGSYGIGKTISFVLFMHLARHINKLLYLATGEWIPIEKRQKFKAELDLLRKYKLFVFAPKCWYWSIRLSDNEQTMMQLIKAQTQELCLSDEYKNKMDACKNFSELVSFIKYLPSGQINSTIIIDQINSLISCFSNWNSSIDNCKELISRGDRQGALKLQEKSENQFYHPGNRIHDLLLKLRPISSYYILNSSLQVENQLLYRRIDGWKLSLNIIDHGDPMRITISFYKQILKESTKIEYCQFFLLLLEQKCKQVNVNASNIKKIVDNFTQLSIKIKSYYRFIFVRQYINALENKQQLFFSLNQPKTDQQISDFFLKLSAEFDDFCLNQSKIRLINYINQGNDANVKAFKRLIVHIIRQEADILLKKGQKQLIIKSNIFQDFAQQYKALQTLYVKDFLLSNLHNQELLPCFQDKTNKRIVFEWSPQDYLQISEGLDIFQVKRQQLLTEIQQPLRSWILNVPPARGYAVEYFISMILFESSSVIFKQYKGEDGIYLLSKKIDFLAFNLRLKHDKQDQKMSLYKNLSNILSQAKAQPNINIIGIPIVRKGNIIEAVAWNNKKIDFIFVKYSIVDDLFYITTFDVTTNKVKVQIKTQQSTLMLKQLLRSKDQRDTNNYKIDHVIICPLNFCRQNKTVSNQLAVRHYPIENVRFVGCKNKSLIVQFEQVKKIYIPVIKKKKTTQQL